MSDAERQATPVQVAGAAAAHTTLPVLGVPLESGALKGFDALLSTVQMPAGVPVATVGIGQARNAGLLAARILGVADARLWPDMDAYRAGLRASAQEKGARLRGEAGGD